MDRVKSLKHAQKSTDFSGHMNLFQHAAQGLKEIGKFLLFIGIIVAGAFLVTFPAWLLASRAPGVYSYLFAGVLIIGLLAAAFYHLRRQIPSEPPTRSRLFLMIIARGGVVLVKLILFMGALLFFFGGISIGSIPISIAGGLALAALTGYSIHRRRQTKKRV